MTGNRPLLFNNPLQFVDPDSEYHIRRAAIPDAKTRENRLKIADLDWQTALYIDEDLGVYGASTMVHKCWIEGGKINKTGRAIKECVSFPDNPMIKLDYRGPRDIEALKRDPQFRLKVPVNIGGSMVMKTRPCFRQWSMTFKAELQEDLLDFNKLVKAVEIAGRIKGIGSWRPYYGTFTAVLTKPEEETE